jgi:hypothetical protein
MRWIHGGQESAEEDAILDQMDDLWWQLTEQERECLRRDPLPEGPVEAQLAQLNDRNVWHEHSVAPRISREAA